MKYPVLPLKMPMVLSSQQNGKINPVLLQRLRGTNGMLYRDAAVAFNCLQLEAMFASVDLQSTSSADTYRTYQQQERTFLDRYSPTPTLRVPVVTRRWNGKLWYLKRGKAPSATPGTSNHGWGLAIDIAGASGKRLEWMLGSTPLQSPVLKYGFSWEIESGKNAEPWHIRYVCGDTPPQSVLDAVAAFPELAG
jgi:hypothetical protein